MEIGARLKEARVAKNLSLEDIQKITKIQVRYLRAIENGEFNLMPGNFYVRAFIKEYAVAVDLDPELLLEEHKEELPSTGDEQTVKYKRVQRSRKESSSSKSPAIFSFLPTIIVVLLIIGTIFVFWKFSQDSPLFNNDEQNQEEPTEDTNTTDQVRLPSGEEDNSDANKDPETNSNDTDTNDTNVEEEEQIDNEEPETAINLVKYENKESTYELLNPGDKLELELETDNEHWLEVENGKGKSFYYAMFYEKDSPLNIDMTGEEQIYLKFGNPASIKIRINGAELELSEEISPQDVQEVWLDVKNEND